MKELALHILDIVENSVSAGASDIRVSILKKGAELLISIEDNGKGIEADEVAKVQDPFYTSRTTRKVGLGIPLLKQHAEMTGGGLEIKSELGVGSKMSAWFNSLHPDIQPLGDLEGSWILLLTSYPDIEFDLDMKTDTGDFRISSGEIKEALGLDKIQGREICLQLKRLIRNNLDEIGL